MTTKPAPKTFDCIAFKRVMQQRIYEDTKDMTIAEQVDYFRRRAEEGPLGEWWRKVKKYRADSQRK